MAIIPSINRILVVSTSGFRGSDGRIYNTQHVRSESCAQYYHSVKYKRFSSRQEFWSDLCEEIEAGYDGW